MGILNKIKDMFFEEDSDDVQINDNRIAKKIELPKRKKNKETIIIHIFKYKYVNSNFYS